MILFTRDTAVCRRLARGAWLTALALYFGLLFLSLGYLGPYWAFLYWSAAAFPLFLLTCYWLYRARGGIPSRLFTLVLTAWASVFLLFWLGDLGDGTTILFWVAFVLTGALPLLITWGLLRQVTNTLAEGPHAAA
jgi:hypothetical protein